MKTSSKFSTLNKKSFSTDSFQENITLKKFSIIASETLKQQDDADFRKNLDIILKKVVILYQVYNRHKINIESLNLYNNKNKFCLTQRQIECLTHLAMGKTIKGIALLLGCSPANVEGHIHRIKQKTHVYTTNALIDFFWRNIFENEILTIFYQRNFG
jgi:DNA-binding NarL/FixJ family response regulator